MKFLVILAALAALSCSTTKDSDKSKDWDLPEAAKAPEWVYAPGQGCADSELCAAGEGESMESADAQARKALAAIFSVKITSQLDIHKTSFSDEEVEELKEFVSDQVNQTVDEVLEAVEIKRRYEREGLFFSLASLERSKAASLLKRKVSSIDNELEHLYRLKRKSSIKRMMGLLDERSLLADKLIVVEGQAGKAPVSFTQIQNLKYASGGFRKVYVQAGEDVPETMVKFMEQLLTGMGYQILDKRAVDYVVELKTRAKRSYLNVEGFQKYVFYVTVAAKDNAQKKLGVFTAAAAQTGRDKRDAYLRAKPTLQEEIEKKIDKLNLK